MRTPGWRKIGDVGEEFCRVLDRLLIDVDALKAAFQRGERPNGVGANVEDIDSKAIWCPELCRPTSPSDSSDRSLETPNLETAKLALIRMKDVKKALFSILGSLEDTISTVTNSVAVECRAAGLAALPDEVLAQIFEFCHFESIRFYDGPKADVAGTLSSVSKRFRRVALHLPLLWKHIFLKTPLGRLPFHAARSNTSCVYLETEYPLKDILNRIHPNRFWEEIDFYALNLAESHELFQELGPRITTPFDSLKRLTINNDHDLEVPEVEEGVYATRLDADMSTLASWKFPRLTFLKLGNFLPTIPMRFSNVTSLEMYFCLFQNSRPMWNLGSLRNLLQSMPKLASLTMELSCHKQRFTANIFDITVERLTLPCLKNLELKFEGHPPPLQIIYQFMELVDTQSLTKLSIYIDQNKRRELRSAVSPRLAEFSAGWVVALFLRSSHPYRMRPFWAVEEFSLKIRPSPDLFQPNFREMFMALPNVKDLSIALPPYLHVDLCQWAELSGGLRELRSLRISEYAPVVYPKYSDFFWELSDANGSLLTQERWKKFERLEILESSRTAFENEELEKYVGNKLVWIGLDEG